MCSLQAHTPLLIWLFVAGAAAMAILSAKLNKHLLAPPPPPKHLWFRKKNHIRPSFLMKPELYFDQTGCQWAWRFTVIATVTGIAFLVILYGILACR